MAEGYPASRAPIKRSPVPRVTGVPPYERDLPGGRLARHLLTIVTVAWLVCGTSGQGLAAEAPDSSRAGEPISSSDLGAKAQTQYQGYVAQATLPGPANNPDENPFDINLSATELTPEIAVEQPAGTDIPDGGSQSFGSVPPGSNTTLTFTIKNTGDGDLTGLGVTINGPDAFQFGVTANPSAPVTAGGTTTFTVRFAPTSIGVKGAALHIANNDPDENPFDISLTGTGRAPVIAVEQPAGTNIADGGSKALGNVAVGANTSLTFTIKNTGNDDLTGLGITIDGTNATMFSVTANPTAPVTPGGTTTFTVRFAPTGSFGSKTAALHIANNDPFPNKNPFDINLSGTALAPEIAVEQPSGTDIVNGGSRDFGSIGLGGDATLTFTIKNTGTSDLTGLGITIDGPDASQFSVTATPTASVPPSDSTTFTVRFAPTSTGAKTAALHIASSDADENPFDIDLTGTGTTPVSVDPAPVAFALEGVRPNPSRGPALTVSFALPTGSAARLELLDVRGRRIVTREVGTLGAGRHLVDLAGGGKVPPGTYWVRLTQGKDHGVTRVVVLR